MQVMCIGENPEKIRKLKIFHRKRMNVKKNLKKHSKNFKKK